MIIASSFREPSLAEFEFNKPKWKKKLSLQTLPLIRNSNFKTSIFGFPPYNEAYLCCDSFSSKIYMYPGKLLSLQQLLT